MNIALIQELHCPYCAGSFRLVRNCLTEKDCLRYGLLECRCFTFPVIDGILLLSLAKGYGGAEEALQPYVPLQVAAIRHLERDDIAGLLGWIRRHMPLAAELIEGTHATYLNVATRLDLAVKVESDRYLAQMGRYRVVGSGRREQWKQRVLGFLPKKRRTSVQHERDCLSSYYVSRFFSPRANALGLYLSSLPVGGTILSLCCGHGVFENLLRADGRAKRVVSIDGQFLNLLITRRYCAPDSDFICHDVQFPLPFQDGFFDGVFSSTCLPEIPAQMSFVREAIRVTSNAGWTVFDSIWNQELGVRRINHMRHYRFCQNFFAALEDYLPLISDCAAGRDVGLDVAGMPDKYLDGPTWAFAGEQEALIAARKDPMINIIITDREKFTGFVPPRRDWLVPGRLSFSPAFTAQGAGDRVVLHRRPAFAQVDADFAQAAFPGYVEHIELDSARLADTDLLRAQYCAGHLALLPDAFSTEQVRVSEATAA
jgi:SAM-dependent methyltransferase